MIKEDIGGEETHPQLREVSIPNGQGSLSEAPSIEVWYWSNRREGPAVLESSCPTNANRVRSFLGMVGLSARFIPNFATIAEPLYEPCTGREYRLYGKIIRKSRIRIYTAVSKCACSSLFR